ncbi:alpha-amylase family protein [Simiduia curdlanivorans]|uniref:Alpha-amylase family protein n=1 Tax=Simiduia curdlanivorans TaxID=1492769 RepID=A0ABV8V5R5_9GAMM|nr:alpha-amylase family protein [Simiduia curdlanivorans]MDN3638220.1 alpha-amylase family protein [Simiduia curdlanivorans]
MKTLIRKSWKAALIASLFAAHLVGCDHRQQEPVNAPKQSDLTEKVVEKKVVYQVFTRLYGNKNTTNKAWGSLEENGVGKFSDFTDVALADIKSLGTTHLWLTGVPHHALVRDYTAYGISNDDPDVVKGRAGSPYAVKDYYSVNPDLADDPSNRLAEFDQLIARAHKHGLKIIIDIVPNHVARNYQSISKPKHVRDFGAEDDSSVAYARDNDFYYVVGEAFKVPLAADGYQPLNGETHPLSDGRFDEMPAKWTGNGSRLAQPDINDWYETVKVNYGVSPDGREDFPALPENLRKAPWPEHANFWRGKDVPASWVKFRDITQYWLARGVDGFRYDMAEMVPVAFWSYLNSAIKQTNPNAFILAEVYNPKEYRNYIQLGLMDYLYDKVELYDTLKWIIQNKASTDDLVAIQDGMADIEHHMLHFLENHDEQRIASPDFAGNPQAAKPAMVISATLSTSPTMLYFGQEVGEPGAEDAGFGKPTRTSIFDYIGVPHHQRWMNNGAFDGGQSSADEKALRAWYSQLLNLTLSQSAFTGHYAQTHSYNRQHSENYPQKLFSFARWNDQQKLLVVSNFDAASASDIDIKIAPHMIKQWRFKDGQYTATDLLSGQSWPLQIDQGAASIKLDLKAFGSVILNIQNP